MAIKGYAVQVGYETYHFTDFKAATSLFKSIQKAKRVSFEYCNGAQAIEIEYQGTLNLLPMALYSKDEFAAVKSAKEIEDAKREKSKND